MKRASEAGMMLKGGMRKRRWEEVLAYLWKKDGEMVGGNEKLDWSQAKECEHPVEGFRSESGVSYFYPLIHV